MGAKHYWELTAWQAVRTFKVGIYDLIERKPLADDIKLREQLRESGRLGAKSYRRRVRAIRSIGQRPLCEDGAWHQCSSVITISAMPLTANESLKTPAASISLRWEAAMKEIGGSPGLSPIVGGQAQRGTATSKRTERRRRRKNGRLEP